jgi:hypothetical protein
VAPIVSVYTSLRRHDMSDVSTDFYAAVSFLVFASTALYAGLSLIDFLAVRTTKED